MFRKDKELLQKEIRDLRTLITDKRKETIADLEKQTQEIANLELQLRNAKIQMREELETFKKTISDKYMESIERLFAFTKELIMIVAVSGNGKEVLSLKRRFARPILEEKWEREKQESAKKIDEGVKTMGRKILDRKTELESKKHKLEREEKDTKEITAQISVLDAIIGGTL